MATLTPVVALYALSAALVAHASVPGGWNEVPVGEAEKARLKAALATESVYDNSITTRLCVLSIDSMRQQVVAGMNYEYDVTACAVGSAAAGEGECPLALAANCQPECYTVSIFERVWTNTTEITSIQRMSTSGSDQDETSQPPSTTSAPGSADASSSHDDEDGDGDGDVTSSPPAPLPTNVAPATTTSLLVALIVLVSLLSSV